MSTDNRTLLLKVLLFLFAMCLVVGIIGSMAHKLDTPSTILLIATFVLSSTLSTWLAVWDACRTRERLASITANLAPHGLAVQACRDGTYEVISQGALFDEIVIEQVDLDELEAFIAGLRHGVMLAETRHEYPEDLEHIGIDGYAQHIPGLED